MQHKYLVVLAGLLVTASAARAQVTFGPRVGANLTTVALDLKDANDDSDPKSLIGGQVGVALNAQFGKVALQPALMVSQKGFKVKEPNRPNYTSTVEEKIRLTYVELPLNLVYTTGGEQGFQVLAGPYVGLGVGGKYTAKGSWTYRDSFVQDRGTIDVKQDIKFANEYPSSNNAGNVYFRTLDAGLNVGLGGKINGFQVQLTYGLGLSNILPDEPNGKAPEDKVRNRGFQLTAGYFFGGN